MYDIFSDIWKHPENAFSQVHAWPRLGAFTGESAAEVISTELSELHKRGVDCIAASPACREAYLTEEYFLNLTSALEALKKRFMTAILYDAGASSLPVIAEEKRLAARRLYVLPARTEIPSDEELLFRVSVAFDEKGKLTETRLSPSEGFSEYDLVLGYSYESTRADALNPQTAYDIIEKSLEAHYTHLGEHFGDTVTGVLVPPVRFAEGEIPWSYGFIEDFSLAGGDMHTLMSLFFEPREKKYRREGELSLRRAISSRLNSSYFAPISSWCESHRIAMLHAPEEANDTPAYRHATSTGALLSEVGISEKSAGVKLASDYARHHGLKRSFAYLTGTEELTPDELMRRLNYAFSGGASMIVHDGIRLHESEDGADPITLRADYKKLGAYVKRMSWLCSTGTHNPHCAVLCTADYVPARSASKITEAGYSFSYLTLEDLMEKCTVRDGKLCIDRYEYGVLLIDSRVRLDAESVTKIGRFVTEGGLMYRGGDFVPFLEKNVRRGSYFKGNSASELTFTHITKGGVDFFVMINSGDAWIEGEFVTDIPCAAENFDPMTGEIATLSCAMCDGGFAYPVRIAPHSVKVIGMNKNALPMIGSEKVYKLREIVSISAERTSFEYKAGAYSRAVLSFEGIDGALDVAVNGKTVGRMMFKPYEVDITEHVTDGKNELGITGDFFGGSVKLYE